MFKYLLGMIPKNKVLSYEGVGGSQNAGTLGQDACSGITVSVFPSLISSDEHGHWPGQFPSWVHTAGSIVHLPVPYIKKCLCPNNQGGKYHFG